MQRLQEFWNIVYYLKGHFPKYVLSNQEDSRPAQTMTGLRNKAEYCKQYSKSHFTVPKDYTFEVLIPVSLVSIFIICHQTNLICQLTIFHSYCHHTNTLHTVVM